MGYQNKERKTINIHLQHFLYKGISVAILNFFQTMFFFLFHADVWFVWFSISFSFFWVLPWQLIDIAQLMPRCEDGPRFVLPFTKEKTTDNAIAQDKPSIDGCSPQQCLHSNACEQINKTQIRSIEYRRAHFVLFVTALRRFTLIHCRHRSIGSLEHPARNLFRRWPFANWNRSVAQSWSIANAAHSIGRLSVASHQFNLNYN